MTMKDSSAQGEPKPVQITTQADEQKSEQEADEPASPTVIQPLNAKGGEQKPAEPYDETDRKQDETLQTIAKQTKWEEKQAEALEKQTGLMETQTSWIRRQAIWTITLTAATLGVLVYHGMMMRGQLAQMESSSNQTQQMLEASQKQANASTIQANTSQSIAEQNRELIAHAGEQANASKTLADVSRTQANASIAQAQTAKQSVGFAATSARAAEQSAQTAAQSLIIGTRPYLGTEADLITLQADKPLILQIKLNNEGNSPAIDVFVQEKVLITSSPQIPTDFTGLTTLQTNPVLPHKFVTVVIPSDQTLSDAWVDAIKQQKRWLHLYGRVWYSGVGGRYELPFCVVYRQDLSSFFDCYQRPK